MNNDKKQRQYPVFLEILPLILFFVVNKFYGIFTATGVLIGTSVFNLAVGYLYTRTFHLISIITCLLAVIFGTLTLVFDNENFIKIKVTIINVVFALVLCSAYVFKRNFLKMILNQHVSLSPKGWKVLNLAWILFFVLLAIINESIWRNFSTNFWVNFKVFGLPILAFIFMLVQMPLIQKYKDKNPKP